ncbi:MAG TPA: molybdate ABC transporter substrate-binding protein, partial [Casimicrobiaceae bacterium]|nr:molybdate ABC transporter substrate-binding protein [Casimicrobiaceae bacterium]
MRPIRSLLSCFVVAVCVAIAPPVAAADNVIVFAAASLKEATDDQARQFERETGNKVIVSYGASNALAKQIEAGAPADLFISADLEWMDYVGQRGLVAPSARFDLLRNTLVLIAPAASSSALKIAPDFGLAAALGNEKLAMANPDSV